MRPDPGAAVPTFLTSALNRPLPRALVWGVVMAPLCMAECALGFVTFHQSWTAGG